MSMTPRNAHVRQRLEATLYQVDEVITQALLPISINSIVPYQCQTRVFNPFNIRYDQLIEQADIEQNSTAFDFYLHGDSNLACCPSASIIAQSIYAVKFSSEDASATSTLIRSVSITQAIDALYTTTSRHTIELTSVPGRRMTRVDSKVSNSLVIASFNELDKALGDFLSLISLGVNHMLIPREGS